MSPALCWLLLAISASGFLLSLAGTMMVRRLAERRGFVDRPGGHKRHAQPVALGGGIAITFALVVPMVGGLIGLQALCHGGIPSWLPADFAVHVPGMMDKTRPGLGIAAATLAMHILGLIDDRRPLGPWTKLAGQVLIATWLTLSIDLRVLTVAGEPASGALTVLWIVLITNAFNLLDNMDGLCAGVAAICAGICALAALRAGQLFVPAMALVLCGTMLGFLWFNLPPARIYMGDAGSLVIGFFLAIFTILTTYVDAQLQRQPALLMPVIILAVPLYDTISVIVIRLRRGLNPLRGDQRHFSHRLVLRGMSPRNAVLTIYLATLATSLSATVLPTAGWPLAGVIVLQCACVVGIIAILEGTGGQPGG